MAAQNDTTTIDLTAIAYAASRLGVHQRTVRRWIADGRLTGYRVGPHLVRLDARELDALPRAIPTAGYAA
jgi:excisionase family DNA binding protein